MQASPVITIGRRPGSLPHLLVLLVGVNRQFHDGIGEAVDRAEVQRPHDGVNVGSGGHAAIATGAGDGVDLRLNTALARMTIALNVQSTLTHGLAHLPVAVGERLTWAPSFFGRKNRR